MPAFKNFTHCRCPHCQAPLDDVLEIAPACPACHHLLDPHDVWLTRRDPGEIVLPLWLRVFDWRFLLMATGATIMLLRYGGLWIIPVNGWIMRAALLLFSFGLIPFLYKFFMHGDD